MLSNLSVMTASWLERCSVSLRSPRTVPSSFGSYYSAAILWRSLLFYFDFPSRSCLRRSPLLISVSNIGITNYFIICAASSGLT